MWVIFSEYSVRTYVCMCGTSDTDWLLQLGIMNDWTPQLLWQVIPDGLFTLKGFSQPDLFPLSFIQFTGKDGLKLDSGLRHLMLTVHPQTESKFVVKYVLILSI